MSSGAMALLREAWGLRVAALLAGLPASSKCSRRGSLSPCNAGTYSQRSPATTAVRLLGWYTSQKLLELVGDLVDAGLGANLVLLAARCAGNADGTYRLLANLDLQRAGKCDDVAQVDGPERRVAFQSLGHLARGDADAACGVGLAAAVLHGVRAGVVAPPLH